MVHKKIAIYMTMVRAEKKLANLGVVYIEGNILVRQYELVIWYWFSEHWSEIPLESESKKCHYETNSCFKKI